MPYLEQNKRVTVVLTLSKVRGCTSCKFCTNNRSLESLIQPKSDHFPTPKRHSPRHLRRPFAATSLLSNARKAKPTGAQARQINVGLPASFCLALTRCRIMQPQFGRPDLLQSSFSALGVRCLCMRSASTACTHTSF